MLYCVLIMLASVLLDQASKQLVLSYLEPVGSYPLINNVLHFTYVENRGAAFGMLSDRRWIFMTVSVAVIIVIFAYIAYAKPKNMWVKTALAMIAGGGIGNMIDRVARGFVVDFIDVTCIKFYVFNIADSFVTVGCAILIVAMIVDEISDAKKKKQSAVSETEDGRNDN